MAGLSMIQRKFGKALSLPSKKFSIVYPAIVWQDRRTAQLCRDLSEDEELVSHITESTGLLLDPYFSATKVAWILDNVEGAAAVWNRRHVPYMALNGW